MKIETAEDLATAKNMSFAPDQLRELEIGCEIWHISGEGWSGSMCRWPGGRGAFMSGSDSCWGEWDGGSLLLDDTDQDGKMITVDEDGEESIGE
jgi:hypothetical protein